eukprot:2117506-Pyramimonas_sp.AAC.1
MSGGEPGNLQPLVRPKKKSPSFIPPLPRGRGRDVRGPTPRTKKKKKTVSAVREGPRDRIRCLVEAIKIRGFSATKGG